MCCVEALGNGASGESRFSCFRFPRRGGDRKGVYHGGASVRVGDSQLGDSSMTIGVFAVPCSIERSMTSGPEKTGEVTEECNPDSGEFETVTRPTSSVGEEWAAALRSEGLEGGTCPSSREYPSWLCPVHCQRKERPMHCRRTNINVCSALAGAKGRRSDMNIVIWFHR
jgi:hypothetical protein